MNRIEPDRTDLQPLRNQKNRENDREKSYSKKKRYIKRIWITWTTRKVCIYFLCLFVGQITGSLSGHVICLLEKLTLSINKFGFMLKLWDFLVFSSEHLISKKLVLLCEIESLVIFDWSHITWVTWLGSLRLYKDYLIIN